MPTDTEANVFGGTCALMQMLASLVGHATDAEASVFGETCPLMQMLSSLWGHAY